MKVHGWNIYFHPCFEEQLVDLVERVMEQAQRRPKDYCQLRPFKLLSAIALLAFDVIPRDPSDERFRQGNTLGNDHTDWFRAKFYQQYRLFFRYSEPDKTVIYAWVNDDSTLRAYESKSDAYRVFEKMLRKGRPPSDWAALKASVLDDAAANNLAARMDMARTSSDVAS
jgi:toxin YhaV